MTTTHKGMTMTTTTTKLTLGGNDVNLGFLDAERGDEVKMAGGVEGRFVGRLKGVDYFAYDFEDMSIVFGVFAIEGAVAFDKKVGRN